MAKLRKSGVASVEIPFGLDRLEEVLARLRQRHIDIELTLEERHNIVYEVGLILGEFSTEAGRLEAADVMAELEDFRRTLSKVRAMAAVLEDGPQDRNEFEAVRRIADAFARRHRSLLLPDIGRGRIEQLGKSAEKLVAATDDAIAKLAAVTGKRGRPRNEWYDWFTHLLVRIASRAGISPKVTADRIDGPGGPFLELAWEMERLLLVLHPTIPTKGMRSPTREACAKRLERSLKARERPNGQKPRWEILVSVVCAGGLGPPAMDTEVP